MAKIPLKAFQLEAAANLSNVIDALVDKMQEVLKEEIASNPNALDWTVRIHSVDLTKPKENGHSVKLDRKIAIDELKLRGYNIFEHGDNRIEFIVSFEDLE